MRAALVAACCLLSGGATGLPAGTETFTLGGTQAVLTVTLTSRIPPGPKYHVSYDVRLGAAASEPWLESEPGLPRLYCGGAWQPAYVQSYTRVNGTDARLGAFDGLQLEAAVDNYPSGPKRCDGSRMRITFTHYRRDDAIAFTQSFPDGVADTTGAPQPLCLSCEFNSSSVPRTEFPAFVTKPGTRLHDELGWWQWGGAMTNARQGGGVGLTGPGYLKQYPTNEGLVGGQEGGPLVLFEAGKAKGDALVFSPMGNWFATVIGMRPLAPAPGNALVGGVQGAVTTIPPGHSAGFLLCATRGQGINAAVARWGDVLRAKFAVPKVKPTVVGTTLGYWTDSKIVILSRFACCPSR